MKSIERLCESIIKMQNKRPEGEYKTEILKAVRKSKRTGYKISPYELMFLKNHGVRV